MPMIATTRDDIRALKGVHLFHFATSNCSQRVRLVLEEKAVGWRSHHVDLGAGENTTPEFIALNPKGLVPVLVHDGCTIVESNDIISYIDQAFPGPVLTPVDACDLAFMQSSLHASSAYQSAIKLLTHEFLFKAVRRLNADQLQAYERVTANAELVAFMREFSSEVGFPRARILSAVKETQTILHTLEARLQQHCWLSGDNFGLTDISWIVNLHRLQHMHYPLERFPYVARWLVRMRARPGFREAVSRFESRKVLAFFRLYTAVRQLRGSSVRNFVEAL